MSLYSAAAMHRAVRLTVPGVLVRGLLGVVVLLITPLVGLCVVGAMAYERMTGRSV